MRKVSSTAEIIGVSKPPIAIGFFESPPAGVPRWGGGSVAAGWCAVHTMRMSRHTRRVCFDSYESASILAEQVSDSIFHIYSYQISS